MSRIGVFGGSFNPPHGAHLKIARAATDQFRLDSVLWIPAAVPPHKQDLELAPAEDRLRMVQILTRDDPTFEASRLELDRKGISWTVDTLRSLSHSDLDLFLILGEDSLAGFSTWREPEAVLALATVIVYRRTDVAEYDVPPGVHFLEGRVMDVSSTELRRRLREGKPIAEQVFPRELRSYADSRQLYRAPGPDLADPT